MRSWPNCSAKSACRPRWTTPWRPIWASAGWTARRLFRNDWALLARLVCKANGRGAVTIAPGATLTFVAGFDAFLAGLEEPRCIASSSPPDWIELGLRHFGAHDVFGGPIFSAAVHVSRGKPHPDLFLYAAKAMKAAPERTLVIEDSPTGVLAGVAAGMTIVGLCAGGHVRGDHPQRLKQAGAHQVFDSYAELAGWIAETA